MTDQKSPAEPGLVHDSGKGSWSDLFRKEDYWAIWLGFGLIAVGLFLFLDSPPEGMDATIAEANTVMEAEAGRVPFKSLAWNDAQGRKAGLKSTNEDFAKTIKKWTSKPHGWKTNPVEAFYLDGAGADARNEAALPRFEAAKQNTADRRAEAEAAEAAAGAAQFGDQGLNQKAEAAIAAWKAAKASESSAKKKASVKPHNQLGFLAALGIFMALFFGIGMKAMGFPMMRFMLGFLFVFLIAAVAYVLAGQATMKEYGIGYAAWAILIGLLISNTVGTPRWVMPAVQVEYYIKTGLVLLGAEILFSKILVIGVPGIFVAWVVTPIVLTVTYLFGQKILKIPSKTLNITLSADMSVCGVSAAIATASACRAKKEELTLAVGLSLVFTSIMMIAMPAFIKAVGISEILGGAWMGGTIDATGAVAAAGAFLGEKALYVAATIKMIQNVLIGVIAFCVAVYWCAKVEAVPGKRVGLMEIWYRFPKFVIGFIVASILLSTLYESIGSDVSTVTIDNGVIKGFTKILRGWFFCFAFVSIGLATNFRELREHFKGGKPLILYVCGQSFNLILTLTMAYIMFFKVFPEILEKI